MCKTCTLCFHAPQADIDREFANANLGLKTFPTIVFFPKVRLPIILCF